MDKPVIVIGRQFGSGGRRIGKIVAETLGIDYYDTEILSKAANRLGVRRELFSEHDEKRPSLLKSILQGSYGIADNFHNVSLTGVSLYNEQSKVIREICKNGGCVIVGRSADIILSDHPNLFSVFLHSPIERRMVAILKRGDAKTEEEAMDLARKHDRRREDFYNFYKGEKVWGFASNYHLSIDTSRLSAEEVAEIIVKCSKHRVENNK